MGFAFSFGCFHDGKPSVPTSSSSKINPNRGSAWSFYRRLPEPCLFSLQLETRATGTTWVTITTSGYAIVARCRPPVPVSACGKRR